MKILILAFILAIVSLAGTSAATAARPNIVVILTDDQGYADIRLNPHVVGKLKREGLFDNTTLLFLTDNAAPPMRASTVAVEGPSPGALFDLTHWKLTLPTDTSNTYGGHAAEVSAAKLAAGFKDSHFRTDADGSMVFWCPVAGATTEGTQYPRCELREMLKPGDEDTNWTTQGTHTLRASCRITQLPSYPKVVIGQVHSYSGKAKPLVKLQYYKDRIEALVKTSPTSGKDRKLTFADAKVGDDIRYEIKVQDNSLSVTVNGETQTEDLMKNDPAWARQSFYFKAGAYPQDNEGPLSEAACVVFSELTVSHRP